MTRNVLRAAAVLVVTMIVATNPAKADDDNGWQALFDGDSADAWRGYNEEEFPDTWGVEDGMLVGSGRGGDIITREQYTDFELELEWKIAARGNSGIMYRVVETDGPSYHTGPEYQVLDNAGNNYDPRQSTAAGGLYGLYKPSVDASKPADEWNTAKIVSKGNVVEHWLNGQKLLTAEIGSDDWNQRVAGSKFNAWKGFGKSEKGHIALQAHGSKVWFRNIRIRVPDEGESTAASDRQIRMLLVTQSEGFQHSTVRRNSGALAHTEQVLTDLGLESGDFRVTCTQDVAKDLKPELIEQFDVVAFYTTGNLPIDEKTLTWLLDEWLQQPGHGFLGLHSAADTYHKYEPYWDMLGGTFAGHPWNANTTVTLKIHDAKHPASRPWGKQFVIKDEIYQFSNWQPEKVRVLMSLDMEQTDLKKPYHVPVLWVKDYGQGRVMHMSLGHREDVWTNPTYQESLLGGIRWLAGLEDGDATPNPEVSAAEDATAKEAVQAASQTTTRDAA